MNSAHKNQNHQIPVFKNFFFNQSSRQRCSRLTKFAQYRHRHLRVCREREKEIKRVVEVPAGDQERVSQVRAGRGGVGFLEMVCVESLRKIWDRIAKWRKKIGASSSNQLESGNLNIIN